MGVGLLPFILIDGKKDAVSQRTAAEEVAMQPVMEERVYICTGGHARKYHRYKGCRGLNACNGEIKEITKQQAARRGRKPCRICH